ncbi:MAG: hypothetical protein ACLQDY_13210 [Streptosporangiaceae bacterium]
MEASLSPSAGPVIPVGAPWRDALRRPVFGTLLLAGAFFLYTAPVKETPVLFDHAPWLNDPFDTVISFMMFFVPLIGIFCMPRLLLCRRSEPLPAARIRDLLRGCRVVLAGISLTLLTEWISVIIGDNRAQWNGATWLQIGLLAVMSAAAVAVIRELRRAGLPGGTQEPGPPGPDWLADFLLLARKQSRLPGLVRRPELRLLSWCEDRLAGAIRRHPLWTPLGASAVFGTGAGINQGIREGYFLPVTIVACALLGIGMFGLLAASGWYLGFIRGGSPLHGTRRRAVDAAVITCIGVLVPFAMRNHLWWLAGSSNSAAGLAQLLQLLAGSAVVIFAAAYACESLLRLHGHPG